jgi:hypothetical protein
MQLSLQMTTSEWPPDIPQLLPTYVKNKNKSLIPSRITSSPASGRFQWNHTDIRVQPLIQSWKSGIGHQKVRSEQPSWVNWSDQLYSLLDEDGKETTEAPSRCSAPPTWKSDDGWPLFDRTSGRGMSGIFPYTWAITMNGTPIMGDTDIL